MDEYIKEVYIIIYSNKCSVVGECLICDWNKKEVITRWGNFK